MTGLVLYLIKFMKDKTDHEQEVAFTRATNDMKDSLKEVDHAIDVRTNQLIFALEKIVSTLHANTALVDKNIQAIYCQRRFK